MSEYINRHGCYAIVFNADLPEGLGVDYLRTDCGWSVVRLEGDTIVEWIANDGGEPEDQVLVRDWDWIPHALNEAYEAGRTESTRVRGKVSTTLEAWLHMQRREDD